MLKKHRVVLQSRSICGEKTACDNILKERMYKLKRWWISEERILKR